MNEINTKKTQELYSVLLGCSIAVILWITIIGRDGTVENIITNQVLYSFKTIKEDILNNGIFGNFLGNIMLFVPIGILFPLVIKRKRWQHILFIGAILSLVVETIQLITSRGFFEVNDIILNTLGAMVGYALLCLIDELFKKGSMNTNRNRN